MKRLVTLGITLALVMGLFCFSVNAETVITGTSDTVTATYGSNNITIALKARKLRVINTGTAAAGYAGYTPVIVSITIYNLGNQNCLINNLKFQLSSDSSESTIVNFENLSTDLFIADSVYDSNGYLSIHASNDYTYSGGIVCPANSNMTYVGIINVSSNWITENQTWRTVDLSSANFYTNMTTTVGDYPCDAEPVDLSIIEEYLSDLTTTLHGIDLDSSTYLPLLRDILSNITFSGNSYSYISDYAQTSTITENHIYNDTNYGYLRVTRRIGRPYLISVDVNNNSTTDTSTVNGTVRYPFLIKVLNYYNTSVSTYYELDIGHLFPSQPITTAVYISNFYSEQFSSIAIASDAYNNTSKLFHSHSENQKSYYNRGYYNTYIYGYYDVPINITPELVDMTYTSDYSQVRPYTGTIYYPRDEYTILRDLYIAYSSVNGTGDLSDQANEAAEQAETIHNQEASYYAQNQAAIEATGLSNYQFTGEQSNGIGSVSNDFTALWNALGSWNSIYIFSMTLTLALTILRHVPNRRKPKEKNTE